jgi:hypothetical protein
MFQDKLTSIGTVQNLKNRAISQQTAENCPAHQYNIGQQ